MAIKSALKLLALTLVAAAISSLGYGALREPQALAISRPAAGSWLRAEWLRQSSALRAAAQEALFPLSETALNLSAAERPARIALPERVSTFLVAIAGGGAPGYNEIALEKNVLYFQRTLRYLGFDPDFATVLFANGNDGQATVRYLDAQGNEQFKSPEIPNLDGAATYSNARNWFRALAQSDQSCPTFLYFTGHGAYNEANEDNNALILWQESLVSARELAHWLDAIPVRDARDRPLVTMMAQCYAGSFANLIYEGGDPTQPVALQTRCGFFATVASRPSVGCTPAVNEADYKDYSSSFFAGLSGRDRLGQPAPSADYNRDGQISYAEAHAFAKVDEATPDWPISTAEAWLQRQLSDRQRQQILSQPMSQWQAIARPEQQHVITALSQKLSYKLDKSYQQAEQAQSAPMPNSVKEAYQKRLQMELLNVGAEAQIRARQEPSEVAVLAKLLGCEASHWQ